MLAASFCYQNGHVHWVVAVDCRMRSYPAKSKTVDRPIVRSERMTASGASPHLDCSAAKVWNPPDSADSRGRRECRLRGSKAVRWLSADGGDFNHRPR
jgi:hypothetical protein